MSTREVGRHGEQLALRYLRRKGYALLCRNYRYGHYEIDLVMQDGDYVVFVEVKAAVCCLRRRGTFWNTDAWRAPPALTWWRSIWPTGRFNIL